MTHADDTLSSDMILSSCPPPQVLLGVDDMDVFKGIELKLQAFERLLEEHPEWRGKVVLVQVRKGRSRGGGMEGSPGCIIQSMRWGCMRLVLLSLNPQWGGVGWGRGPGVEGRSAVELQCCDVL